VPSGWREQELPVKLEMLELLVPQCWHSYLGFSVA
jgi:hypothetical protein